MSAVSGTTRDAVDTELVAADGQRFNLIDTAGIRKRAAVTESRDGAEPLSVQRAIQAVRRAQVEMVLSFPAGVSFMLGILHASRGSTMRC